MKRITVKNFWLQPTASFPEGAPNRVGYETDEAHLLDCRHYGSEWRSRYVCANNECNNRDCPQHFPIE